MGLAGCFFFENFERETNTQSCLHSAERMKSVFSRRFEHEKRDSSFFVFSRDGVELPHLIFASAKDLDSELQKILLKLHTHRSEIRSDNLSLARFYEKNFALLEHKSRSLVLARDPMGKEPLYYCKTKDFLAFASEIKPLLALLDTPARINSAGLLQSFCYAEVAGQDLHLTAFENIFSIPPGHILTCQSKEIQILPYWDFHFQNKNFSSKDIPQDFAKLTTNVVQKYLLGHSKAAVSVSGGLDSSALFAVANQVSRQSEFGLVGISYTSKRSECDESRYLQDLELQCQTPIQKFPLEDISWNFDPLEQIKIHESPLLDFFWPLTRTLNQSLSDQGVSLMLTGHFGDQILFDQSYLVDLFKSLQWREIKNQFTGFAKWMEASEVQFRRQQFLRGLGKEMLPNSLQNLYRKGRNLRRDSQSLRQNLMGPVLKEALIKWQPTNQVFTNASSQAQALYRQTKLRYHVDSLEWQNKIYAHFGMDVEFPYFDKDLVQWMIQLPGHLQNLNGTPRSLLRFAFKDLLPRSIQERRDKGDYSLFLNKGVHTDLDQITDLLHSGSFIVKEGLIDENKLQSLIKSFQSSNQDATQSWDLMDLVGLETWSQYFFAGGLKADLGKDSERQAHMAKETKKPYQKPKVKVLGSVSELTKAKGGDKQDGSSLPRSRSSGQPGKG